MATLRTHIRQGNGYKWWILGMIMLGTFMAVLDVTVVNVGLPAIMSSFKIGISTAEWVITAYMITMTVMLPSAGWFADRFGNKRVYILGMVLFTLGSWLCGKSPSEGEDREGHEQHDGRESLPVERVAHVAPPLLLDEDREQDGQQPHRDVHVENLVPTVCVDQITAQQGSE